MGSARRGGNLWAALCLHFAYYNFCRVHMKLRVTPAMESKLTDHIWTIGELLATQDEDITETSAPRSLRCYC